MGKTIKQKEKYETTKKGDADNARRLTRQKNSVTKWKKATMADVCTYD